MSEHESVKKDKKGDEDKRHHTKQQDSEPVFDQSLAQDIGPSSLTETPFYPRMDEHAAMLSSIPSAAQRNKFILQLHQTYGNSYVQRLMESIDVQAKLTVSEPGDIYEQEADRVADVVIKAVNSPAQRQPEEEEELLQGKPLVQRQEEEEELLQGKSLVQQQPEEEEELQTQPDASQVAKVSDDIESRIDSARSGGQPLADNIHKPMEQAFGADFSGVHVHTGPEADALNQQLGARAFTTGQDVFFREGEYSPGSDSGKKLIAHELTHVVQQGTSMVNFPAQRNQWVDGEVNWYGTQNIPDREPQQEDMNCWASAIGEVLGMSQILIQNLLGISVRTVTGITEEKENELVAKIQKQLKRNLIQVDWDEIKTNPDQYHANMPMALRLGLALHYVVLMAIGVEGDQSAYVRWWDPWDGNYHEDTIGGLEGEGPAYAYYKG